VWVNINIFSHKTDDQDLVLPQATILGEIWFHKILLLVSQDYLHQEAYASSRHDVQPGTALPVAP
jgi:hypothetical protein